MAFHKEQVRPKIKQENIDNARKIVVDGDRVLSGATPAQRLSARRLAGKVRDSYSQLRKWYSLNNNITGRAEDKKSDSKNWDLLVELYKGNRERIPNPGVFKALFEELHGFSDYYCVTAHKNGANPHSLKMLAKRFKRRDEYARRLGAIK